MSRRGRHHGRGTLHFRNKTAYQKWNAFRWMHIEGRRGHHHRNRRVKIAGRYHHVRHRKRRYHRRR